MSAFPTEPRERIAMFACYALTVLLAVLVIFPRDCARFLIGVLS